MSHKQAKRIRNGHDFFRWGLLSGHKDSLKNMYRQRDYNRPIENPVFGYGYVTGSITLTYNSPRAQYKKMKKLYKRREP